MATRYHITKMKGPTLKVRSCSSSNPDCSASGSQQIPPSRQNSKDPVSHPASLESKMPTLPAHLESRTTTPLCSLESRTATSSPTLQRGPGGSPTTQSSTSSSSSGGAQRGQPMKTASKLGILVVEPQAFLLATTRDGRGG